MHSPDNHTPVSIVTKHIKIYSDNPIHDCIDRIIDNSSALDEGKNNFFHAAQMMEATEELHELLRNKLFSESPLNLQNMFKKRK